MPTCRLCLRDSKLRVSHFMPAALYPTTKTIVYSMQGASGVAPEELRDHLLCDECEGRFDKHGETPVLRWIAPKETHDPLPLLAKISAPVRTFDRFTVHSFPCPSEPFAYFALSLAWRYAVHAWTLPDGTTTAPFPMGKHEEPVRRYLLGEAPFPTDAAVLLTACSAGARTDWVSPTGGARPEHGCIVYQTLIYGLNFVVWFGAGIPVGLKRLCCYSSTEKPLLVTECSDVVAFHLSTLAPLPIAPKRGMTASEVEAMLGQPERRTSTSASLIYRYATKEVLFRAGKVYRVEERAERGRRARARRKL